MKPCWTAIVVGVALGCSGCVDQPAKKGELPTKVESPKPSRPVDQVLDRMLAAYRDAKSYRDEAVLLIKIKSPMGDNMGDFDAKLEFQRPNLLRMDFQPPVWMDTDLSPRLIVGDGKKVYAKSAPYENQFVAVDTPQQNLADKLAESKLLGALLTDEIVGGNFVLRLLASAQLPAGLDREKAKLLEKEKIEGDECNRVQFDTEKGKLVLWIDAKNSVVRRIEFPTTKLLEEMKPKGLTAIEASVDMNKAELNAAIPAERFTWTKDKADVQVGEWIEPPSGADVVSKLVGEPVPEFQFITPSGEKRASKTLSGKVTVIDFWATWCVWCLKGMPAVEEVRKKYAENPKVQFLALSQDDQEVTNEQIVETLKRVKADPPWARLTGETPDDLNAKFQFEGIPALVVLGADGRVQYVHVGFDPKIAENLPPVIDGLLAGKDPSVLAKEVHERKMSDYRRRLEAARVDAAKER
ncbi:MAG: redoxin family protein [Planctomycetes bacterium]|nr:redoxin family protein [Planctomycetota bacterium]